MGQGPPGVFGKRRVPCVRAGLLSRCLETPAWICAQGSHHALLQSGGEPASTALGGGRSSLSVAVSRKSIAHIRGPHPELKNIWAALCLPRRSAEREGCLQTEVGCRLGVPVSRRAVPPGGEGSLHSKCCLLPCIGARRLFGRHLQSYGLGDTIHLRKILQYHLYSLSLHHHRYVDCAIGAPCTASGSVAYAAQPVSLAHVHNSTRLRDSVCQATSQVQRRSWDVGGSPECPCLVRGDCCLPGKGCNQAGPSSRDEAGDLQPLFHRTQERWWHSAKSWICESLTGL